jgi:hypothetical protein
MRDSSERQARTAIAAGFLVTFLLGSTGIAAALRHDDDDGGDVAMRRFCASYRSLTSLEPIRDFRPSNTDRPEVQAALRSYERTLALARTSGNPRIVEAFAAMERDLESAGSPGTTPAEVEQRAQQTVDLFLASFQATFEECRKVGVPIVGDD